MKFIPKTHASDLGACWKNNNKPIFSFTKPIIIFMFEINLFYSQKSNFKKL